MPQLDTTEALAAANELLQRGQFNEACASLSALQDTECAQQIQFWKVFAWVTNRIGQHAEAAAHYSRAVDLDPLSPQLRLSQAQCLAKARDFSGTEIVLTELRDLGLNLSQEVSVATLYIRIGGFRQAEEILSSLYAKGVKSPEVLSRLAAVALRMLKYDFALKLLAENEEHNNLDEWAIRRNRSLMGLTALAQGDLSSAAAVYSSVPPLPSGDVTDEAQRSSFERQQKEREHYVSSKTTKSVAPISGSCIRAREDWNKIDTEMSDMGQSFVVVDDFLTPEAAEAIRSFLLEDVVWSAQNNDSELIVSLDSGMTSPAVLSVAHEIRNLLPRMLKSNPLTQAWAYHYRSYANCVRGHADDGKFSVNLWLTPDEFNLGDDDRGGLVLLPEKQASTGLYGSGGSLIFDTSKYTEERKIVPYRFNRAIIFNAMTIHETDEFDFASRYDQRRINMTFLFGWP